MIIGSHVSYKKEDGLVGSVKEAISYGANTFMFYTGAPQNTNRSPIDMQLVEEAKILMKDNKIDINNVVVHAPYIINLASSNDFAVSFLKQEIDRCIKIGIKKLVIHPGSYVKLTKEEGINNIINNLNKVLDEKINIIILLETMSGKGTEIGSCFEEIAYIINHIKYKEKVGVCLDTCHINDASYAVDDIEKVLNDFDKIVGIEKLLCIHINDSKNIIGSKKDRHENIGFGNLGFDNILNIIYNDKLKDIPKILETPYVGENEKERLYPPYKFEIEMIKNKKFDNKMIEKIIEYYNN